MISAYIRTIKDMNENAMSHKTNTKPIYGDSENRLGGIANDTKLPYFIPNLSYFDTISMHQSDKVE